MPIVRLKPGHVQPVWAGHPWIYAQAIERIEGGATAGDEVHVVDPRGNFLGRGFYSPGSAIPVRVLVRDETTRIDGYFFHARMSRAMAWRRELKLPGPETTGYRLVHADGDGMPGLIVDVFDDVATLQLLTFGMKAREALILQAILDVSRCKTIVDRTPVKMAKTEGFDAASGVVIGQETKELNFKERGLRYQIPLEIGQKTGFYFDQRPLRTRVEHLSADKRVLDAYSYIGPFAMAAARGGAREVVAVDESALALEVGAECARHNGLEGKIKFEKRDARIAMQEAGESGGFDLVLADPPRLAPTRGSRDNALVGYTKVAELAARATKLGGLLVLSSCSAAVDLQSLTRALAVGALRANRSAIVIDRSHQGPDHPVNAAHPEGLYLKSVIARVEAR